MLKIESMKFVKIILRTITIFAKLLFPLTMYPGNSACYQNSWTAQSGYEDLNLNRHIFFISLDFPIESFVTKFYLNQKLLRLIWDKVFKRVLSNFLNLKLNFRIKFPNLNLNLGIKFQVFVIAFKILWSKIKFS